MVDNLTLGIDATHTRTRINTVQILAGTGAGTISIDGTLWPAGNVRIAEILGDTLAGSSSGTVAANGIVAAGCWVARVYYFCRCGWCCNSTTGNKGIAFITRVTTAHREMVLDRASCVGPTHTRTRIHTVLVDTGEVARTLGVHHTLGLALNVGVAGIVADTGTAGGLVALTAEGVDAAGRGVAGIYNHYW